MRAAEDQRECVGHCELAFDGRCFQMLDAGGVVGEVVIRLDGEVAQGLTQFLSGYVEAGLRVVARVRVGSGRRGER
jgi:hypothetical protein